MFQLGEAYEKCALRPCETTEIARFLPGRGLCLVFAPGSPEIC